MDVVYQNLLNGSLDHAVFLQNRQWIGETIDPQPGPISGAPAAVSPNPGQLDVFVRAIGTPDISGGLVHWHKDPSMPFSPPDYLLDIQDNSGLGPPTAVSWRPGRIDVFTGDTYAGIAHFSNNDGGPFSAEHFSQVFAITPPVAVSRASYIDVFTYTAGGDLQDLTYNGSTWSLLDMDITDLYFGFPADLISAAPWNGPSGVAGSATQIYVSGLLLQFSPSRNIMTSFARTENRGTVPIAASADGSEVIAVYQTDGDPRNGDVAGFYEALRWSGNTASPPQKINGSFSSPAQIVYGTDGYPEVLGVGWDGCLYETVLDYWSGGPVVNGPNATGICGLR